MTYDEWEGSVPGQLKADSLWKMTAYRLALFAADLGWHDATKLAKDRRTLSLADQLYRAVGSISSNTAEGYSRGTGKDRARFYEYALESARESRDWYFKARHILGPQVTSHRLDLLTEIIKLLLTMVPEQRSSVVREATEEYEPKRSNLLYNVPLP